IELHSLLSRSMEEFATSARGFETTPYPAILATTTAYLLFSWWLGHRSTQLDRLRAVGPANSPRLVSLTALLPLATGFLTRTFVKELWRSSSPEVDFEDTRSWRRRPVPPLVGWWFGSAMAAGITWLLWLADFFALAAMPRADAEAIGQYLLITLAMSSLQIVAALLTLVLVQRIDERQLERFRIIRRRYEAKTAGPAGIAPTGMAARVPLSAAHCFKALGIAVVFQVIFLLAATVLGLPLFLHLFSTQAILFAVAVTLSHTEGVPLRRLASWSKPHWLDLTGAFLVGVGAFLLASMVLFPWIAERFVDQRRVDALQELFESVPAVSILAPLLILVIAPLVEEILFRGVLFEALSTALSTPMVIVLTAGIFALIHGNLPQGIATFVLGLHCGLARALTGSVAAPIGIHAINNLAATLLLPSDLAAGKALPGVLALPAMIWLLAGYGLLMRDRLRQLWTAAGEPPTVTGAPAFGDSAALRARDAVNSVLNGLRRLETSLQPGAPGHRRLHEGATRAAIRTRHIGRSALQFLRAQLLGGPLAHGLAVGLATLYALRYLALTAQSWRQTGSVTLAIAAFFGFWAWGMWCERRAQSALFLTLFLMARLSLALTDGFGGRDLATAALFTLGTVAIFRRQHVRSISTRRFDADEVPVGPE
ncbi:MAG: type II CAAX endopeptidase family protein, partial [Acidobacteriota bacterium]